MSGNKRPLPVLLFWKAHRWIYKASRGKIGQKMGNLNNLMLTTTGRKSGLARNIVITYFEIEDKIVIIGSNLGSQKHPAWYLNLIANPEVNVQIGIESKPMLAREVLGEEREKLWNEVLSIEKAYAGYGDKTKRRIPVVVFEEIK